MSHVVTEWRQMSKADGQERREDIQMDCVVSGTGPVSFHSERTPMWYTSPEDAARKRTI